jgi:predicted PurR-regulated permease PerM
MNRKTGLTEAAQLLRIVTFVVVVAALYFGRTVFIPLALALLLSLLLAPAMTFLIKLRFPRLLSLIVVAAVLGGVAFGLAWQLSIEFTDLTDQLPGYKATLEEKIQSFGTFRNSNFSRVSETFGDLENELLKGGASVTDATGAKRTPPAGSSPSRPVNVKVVPPSNTIASVEGVLGSMGAAGMVIIFTIFILMGREDLRNRFIHLTSGGRLTVVTQALDEATRRIQRYLFLQSAVNAAFGVVVGIGLTLIGIPEAWLWGLMAAILRFLPYVGAPAAAGIPIVLSLAAFPGWGHAVGTMAFFFVLELLVANVVEPLLYGAQVGLSPLAILVSAVFWTLIWGFPGLILATPLTVTLVVMGRYIPSLSFLKILLGDQPEISPADLFYQRLLASDQIEARQVLELYLKDHYLDELYSDVLIPTLSLVEQDRHRGELDAPTLSFIMQSTREFVEDLSDDIVISGPDTQRFMEARAQARVICVSAQDEGDEIAASMLSRLIERMGLVSHCISSGSSQETIAALVDADPTLICISALPPFAVEHTRVLYQKIRSRLPDVAVVVCLWRFTGEVSKAQRRLKVDARHPISNTLTDALLAVKEQVQGGTREMMELDNAMEFDQANEQPVDQETIPAA